MPNHILVDGPLPESILGLFDEGDILYQITDLQDEDERWGVIEGYFT